MWKTGTLVAWCQVPSNYRPRGWVWGRSNPLWRGPSLLPAEDAPLFQSAHFSAFFCAPLRLQTLHCCAGFRSQTMFFGCSSFSNGTLSFFPQILLLSLISTDFHQVSVMVMMMIMVMMVLVVVVMMTDMMIMMMTKNNFR